MFLLELKAMAALQPQRTDMPELDVDSAVVSRCRIGIANLCLGILAYRPVP